MVEPHYTLCYAANAGETVVFYIDDFQKITRLCKLFAYYQLRNLFVTPWNGAAILGVNETIKCFLRSCKFVVISYSLAAKVYKAV